MPLAGIDETKTLSFVATKLEIGLSGVGGIAPVAYLDMGLQDEEEILAEASPVVVGKATTTQEIKNGYDLSIKTGAFQVKELAEYDTFDNKDCHIKATSKEGRNVVFANVYPHIRKIGLALSKKGVSKISLEATKHATGTAALWTINEPI